MTPLLPVSLYALFLAAAGLPLYIHLPRYATAELGLSLSALGWVLIGIRVLDFAQDPLLGRLIDRCPDRRGLFGTVALLGMGAGFLGLFSWAPPVDATIWLIATLVLLFTCYSLGTILFYGQSVALAGGRAGTDLLRVAAWRESGALIGVVLAALAPSLLAWGGSERGGYGAFGVALAALAVILVWATAPLWRGPYQAEEAFSWKRLRGSGAQHLLILATVNALPVAITSTLFLFFVEDRLRLPNAAAPFLILFFVAAGLSVPVWTALAGRIGARGVLLAAMTMSIVAFVGAAAIPAGASLAFAVICFASGGALGADMVILPALFAAALHRAGLREGAAFGVWSLALKLALAVAAVLVLPMLDWAGYAPGGQNDAMALRALTVAYAIVPCVVKVAAIALVLRLPAEVLRT